MFKTGQEPVSKQESFAMVYYITRIDDDNYIRGDAVLKKVKKQIFPKYDYVILSDYAKGALDEAREIIALSINLIVKLLLIPKKTFIFMKVLG